MSSKTDPRAFRAVQVPGAEDAALHFVGDEPELDPRDAEIASLKRELALRPSVAQPSLVATEFETPHGKLAREMSPYGHLTVEQLMASIDAGEAREPMTSVLCKDGWYARRN